MHWLQCVTQVTAQFIESLERGVRLSHQRSAIQESCSLKQLPGVLELEGKPRSEPEPYKPHLHLLGDMETPRRLWHEASTRPHIPVLPSFGDTLRASQGPTETRVAMLQLGKTLENEHSDIFQ